MATQRQTDANRRNAALSTGPRSQAGKARASLNALKHGLTGAKQIVIPGEDPQEFVEFEQAVFDAIEPQTALEAESARQLAVDYWRLRRIPAIEAAVFAQVAHKQREDAARPTAATRYHLEPESPEEARRLDLGKVMTGLLQHGVIDKLTRYDVSLHRQISARLKQLEDLQAQRAKAE